MKDQIPIFPQWLLVAFALFFWNSLFVIFLLILGLALFTIVLLS